MPEQERKRVRLTEADQARAKVLMKEIAERKNELTRISTRVLNLVLPGPSGVGGSTIIPPGNVIAMEMIEIPTEPPTFACMVATDQGLWDLEYPCGSGHFTG